MVNRSLSLAPQTGWLPARDCGGQQHGVSGGRRLPSALEAASPLGTSVCTALPGKARLRTGTAACAGYRRARASRGEGGHSRAGCPGSADFRHRGRSCPHGGCVRPGRPTAGHPGQRVAGMMLAGSVRAPVSGWRRAVAAGSAGAASDNSGCGPVPASPASGETMPGALWSPAAGNRGLCSWQAHNGHRGSRSS